MEKGLKNLQTVHRSAKRKQRGMSQPRSDINQVANCNQMTNQISDRQQLRPHLPTRASGTSAPE